MTTKSYSEHLKLVNPDLCHYVETNIFPQYSQNDWGHNIDHIKYVIRRSLKFASTLPKTDQINFDIVYTVAAFHDLGHHVDAIHHEKVSAQLLRQDKTIAKFFSPTEIITIAEAIEDHRSKLDHPARSIYGKIVSSADCNINIDSMLRRTFTYRVRNFTAGSLDDIIKESQQHLCKKYGTNGYAKNKMHFDDPEFLSAIAELQDLINNDDLFLQRYLKINHLEHSYQLEHELANYLKSVDPDLRQYVEQEVFPQYTQNDQAHGILHIREVIRRSFLLNQTFALGLDPNLIYAVAAYHDLGKHIDSDRHEFISAKLFQQDAMMSKFFSDNERTAIAEAIEDHRSSKADHPRSTYGKLISSADRNTRVEMVFVRSFFVGKDRQPQTTVADFLEATHTRLSKRYGLENSENMFYADDEYQKFLTDMRQLLQDKTAFYDKYCEINQISSREHTLAKESGVEISPVILI